MTSGARPWIPEPSLRVAHRRTSRAPADALWAAAQEVPLRDTGLLGRLICWRIPGLAADLPFGDLFRGAPFLVLDEGPRHLVAGLVGRIWTLRRDYPALADADAFANWDAPGTARVAFAHWVTERGDGAQLAVEAHVEAIGRQGSVGVAAVRPLVRGFGSLVGSEGLAAAVRRAERAEV